MKFGYIFSFACIVYFVTFLFIGKMITDAVYKKYGLGRFGQTLFLCWLFSMASIVALIYLYLNLLK